MIGRLRNLFTSPTFWVFLGLVALALLIWYVGPLVAIADYRPLESVRARSIAIAVVFLLWLLVLLVRWWRAKDINARLLSQIAKAQPAPGGKAGTEEVAELRRRFESAVAVLKKTRLKRREGGLLSRLSGQHIYQLPWYMFVGAPGSGKTTALVNSGLDFPLAEQFGKAAIRGIGGTRNCDWWFTNDAVLLDTAGRYATQESNESVDRAEWEGFVGLLKRYRPRQPVNGVLLTVSVGDLLSLSEAERTLQSAALKKRLEELRDALGIQFPVYVLVTKADLLAGFAEYFGSLGKEEREQVWGFTLPYHPEGGTTPFTDLYRREYQLLLDRLNNGLPELLIAERDPQRRALMYALPQQVAGLRELLERFLAPLFADSRFADAVLVRGVYFTSGTQEGTPFDRVLGAIQRQFRVDVPVAPGSRAAEGKSYFLHDLLKQVIFGEAHLAGRNLKWERRRRWLRIAGYTVTGIALAGLTVGFLVSYGNNKAYLAQVQARATAFAAKVQETGKDESLPPLLAVLDEARALAQPSGFPLGNPPLRYRFWLYQGTKMDAAAAQVYRRLLDDGLRPRVAQRIQALLREIPPDNVEAQYEVLKRYLMLHDAERYDGGAIQELVLLDWDNTIGRELPTELRKSLETHLQALFGERVVTSPYPRDEQLVAEVRQRLARSSPAERAYSRVRQRARARISAPDFTVIDAAGPAAGSVFVRESGAPLSQGIPALFTLRGYNEGFAKELGILGTPLGEEGWVLADPKRGASDRERAAAAAEKVAEKLDDGATRRLTAEVKRLYMQEYVRRWDQLLGDLKLRPTRSLQESIVLARELGAPDSPLSQLVLAVAKETTLTPPPGTTTTDSMLQKGAQKAKELVARELGSALGTSLGVPQARPPDTAEQIVDRHFEAYRRLAGSDKAAGEMEAVRKLINEIYGYLVSTDTAAQRGLPPPASDTVTRARAEAARLPIPVSRMVESLVGSGSAQAAGITRGAMAANASAQVGDACRKALEGRYPVDRASSKDVLPDDFARLFAPGGTFDAYFQQNLASIVDMRTNPWTIRAGSDAGTAPAGWLSAFQRAAVIRDVYFRGGARSPSIRVQLRPLELDSAVTTMNLDVDGQLVSYTQGGSVQPQLVSWPGPKGTNQVRLELVSGSSAPASGSGGAAAGAAAAAGTGGSGTGVPAKGGSATAGSPAGGAGTGGAGTGGAGGVGAGATGSSTAGGAASPAAGGTGATAAKPAPVVVKTVVTEGPWALHRFFDRMQLSQGSAPERFVATGTFEGRRVVMEVTVGSVENPLRLRQLEGFRCPSLK